LARILIHQAACCGLPLGGIIVRLFLKISIFLCLAFWLLIEDANAGEKVSVRAFTSGMQGTSFTIPPGALDGSELLVGYQNTLPGAFGPEAVAAGAVAVSKTLVLRVASSELPEFFEPITISMPYDRAVAGELPPIVLRWDALARRYRAVSVIGIDREEGVVTFRTSNIANFTAVIVPLVPKK
jgi:hypothetical protein